MNIKEAARALEQAIADMEHAEEDWVTAKARMEGMRQVARGILTAFPELRQHLTDCERVELRLDDSLRPRGSAAVKEILESRPNQALTVAEIVADLDERGWLPASDNPSNAVRVALERLVDGRRFFKRQGDDGNPVRYYFVDGTDLIAGMSASTRARLAGGVRVAADEADGGAAG